MSGEVVDTMQGVDEGTQADGVTEKMDLDDLEGRAHKAVELGHVAIDEMDGDALEGIAHTLLAFKRKECDP